MRRVNEHPWWCARRELCTAHRRGGEHRSEPMQVQTASCRLVATRAQTAGGRARIELRAVIDLTGEPARVRQTAAAAFVGVLKAIDPGRNTPRRGVR